MVLPVIGYLGAVVSGLTTSSLGLLSESGKDDVPGLLGDALPVRSDEWLTAAPIELATLANGSAMTTPLSQQPDLIYQVSSGSPFTSLLFADGNLLRLGQWLPDTMLFAAFRGFPWLLLMLTLPPLLRRLGATRSMSWLAVALCFLAPASLWWSFMPIRILAFAAAGSYALVLARDRLANRRLASGLLLGALAGLLLARLVTFYVPWSLTVGLPLAAATAAFLLRDRPRRAAWMAIGAGATAGVVLLALVFLEQWAALHAELNTVYPGQRRASGFAVPLHQLLGAPGLTGIQDEAPPLNTNQSELSSAFLICGVVAAMLWSSVRRGLAPAQRTAATVLAAGTALFVAWCTLPWGAVGESIPGLNTVLPQRAAQTVGYPATILMCLVLAAYGRSAEAGTDPREARRARLRRGSAVAGVAAAVTGYAVSGLQGVLPDLATWEVWASAAVVATASYLLVGYPRHWAPPAAAALTALAVAWSVNPLMFGLGEVRTSDAAQKARGFRAQALAGDFRFAADSMFTNALLVSNGVPMLNGYQVTGPKRDGWEQLDPEGEQERVWNRGASYLVLSFDGSRGAAPEVIEVQNDIVKIRTDACWLAASSFDVERIVSGVSVRSPCARQIGEFTWNGAPQKVYALSER